MDPNDFPAPREGFVVTHFLALVVFLPNAYGYRQVLPMDLLMLPFAPLAPLALARAGRRVWSARTAKHTPRPSLSVGRGG